MPREFPLSPAAASSLGLDDRQLARLSEIVASHAAERRYPGGQLAIARNGKLAVTVGDARLDPRAAASDNTLWLLYSNTKVITACAVWLLVEQGALRFSDPIAARQADEQLIAEAERYRDALAYEAAIIEAA